MNQRTTDELLNVLNSIDSVRELKEFTQETQHEIAFSSFADFINYHMKKSKISASELIRQANIQRNYGYQILNGIKNPGREKVISFCLTLCLSLSQVQQALTITGEAVLYPKKRRDSIIIFAINHKLSVIETNELLYEMNEETL